MEIRVVLVTHESGEAAEELAGRLIEERLAACGNVIPGLVSVFRWEGEIQRDPEVLLILKTTADRVEALTARVRELHSYDVPEVLALPVRGGLREYMAWVQQECGEDQSGG